MTADTTRRLRPEKRRAILAAARTVFARHGFVLANTANIAAEAGVSTRTLYNHFPSKAELFTAVLAEGANTIATALSERLAALPPDQNAAATVLGIAHALAIHRLEFREHFAAASFAEVEHAQLPDGVLASLQAAGPDVVRTAVADRLAALDLADADHAADQLSLLVAGPIAFRQRIGAVLTQQEIDDIITTGVRTFLYGHLPRDD